MKGNMVSVIDESVQENHVSLSRSYFSFTCYPHVPRHKDNDPSARCNIPTTAPTQPFRIGPFHAGCRDNSANWPFRYGNSSTEGDLMASSGHPLIASTVNQTTVPSSGRKSGMHFRYEDLERERPNQDGCGRT